MASFSAAFASARKGGKKSFSWNGKSYNTKLAGSDKAPKKVPTPTPKPTQAVAEKTPSASTTRKRADFPKPMTDVGIARKGSAISKVKATMDNTPTVTKTPTPSERGAQRIAFVKAGQAEAAKKRDMQGPTPEGVWYARKGSAMSIGAARRANKPVKK